MRSFTVLSDHTLLDANNHQILCPFSALIGKNGAFRLPCTTTCAAYRYDNHKNAYCGINHFTIGVKS